MDRFVLLTGIAGLVFLTSALVLLIHSTVQTIKGRQKVKVFLSRLLLSLFLIVFASSLIYLSLFMQTFARYQHEERIGWVCTEPANDSTRMTFYIERENRMHFFNIVGDQWMIEGYFLRWGALLRWLGAGSYYRITRFSGRREIGEDALISIYQIHPEERLWRFLLKHAEKIPGVDTAYGIAAFQYATSDTMFVYINDTGFILRRR